MTRLLFTGLALAVLVSTLIGLTGCGAPPTSGNQTTASNGAKPPANAAPATATISCTALPEDIVDAIYAELEMSKSIVREEWQWNISVSDAGSRRTVFLTGWSANRDHIFNTVKRVAPDCQWNDTNFKLTRAELPANYRYPVSCVQGYKPCGDICIPEAESCKIVGSSTTIVPPTNSSNSNTGGNANSNSAPSNSNSNGAK